MSSSEGVLTAAIARKGKFCAIVRLPIGGSCNIPLDVNSPADISLLTWAFVDIGGNASVDPACLMILAGTTADALRVGCTITVRAHIRDLTLVLSESQVDLSREERALVAKAVIRALSPSNAHRFAPVLSLLTPDLDAIMPAPGAPKIASLDVAGNLTLRHCDFVPEHLLARTEKGYLCLPIDTVRANSGSPVTAVVTPASLRGLGRYDRAILVGRGRHVAVRIGEYRQ